MSLKKTPLFPFHEKQARIVPFAGFHMPVQYTGVLEEVNVVRQKVGLFDVSHMGQFSLRGKNALSSLNELVTNNLERVSLGQAQYNLLCHPQGGVVDDLIIYRRSENHIYICVNASNIEKDFSWIKEHLAKDILLENESDQTALIAVQGPNACALVCEIIHPEIKNLTYYWAQESKIDSMPIYLSRTGYTGEDGFEIYCNSKDAMNIWERFLEQGQKYSIQPCGLGARDTLRVEMGYPLYGHEISIEISPLEAGLNWVVKLNKNSFIGKEYLVEENEKGPKRILKGLSLNDKRIPRQDYPIENKLGQKMGVVTSGTFSPTLNKPIALALVEKSILQNSEEAFVPIRNEKISIQWTSLPFINPKVKKISK